MSKTFKDKNKEYAKEDSPSGKLAARRLRDERRSKRHLSPPNRRSSSGSTERSEGEHH